METSKKRKAPVTYNQRHDNAEWFTPKIYVDAARNVLGRIDLDPASCLIANETIKAEKFFTAEDNGLTQEWHGKIFLNPPFTRGLIQKFVDKFVSEYERGNINAAILLVNSSTDTRWFRKLSELCAGIVFTTGRIKFKQLDGTTAKSTSPCGQAFFYFGSDADKFFATFQQFGWYLQKK